MPSTPSTRLRIELQALGENLNTWGSDKLNGALTRLEESIAGVTSVAISGTSTTLTSTNYASDQSRAAALVLTGTLSANSTITVPSVEKLYLIVNNTTQGAYSLTIKTSGGSGYALRPGPQWVYGSGSDVLRATPRLDQIPLPTADLALNNRKITGLATPTLGTDAVTKDYSDAAGTAIIAQTTGLIATANQAVTDATAAAAAAQNAAADVTQQVDELAVLLADGPVASVNGMGGAVVLTAADVGAATAGHSHSDATTGAAGFMSATDKQKLDNATSASTASRIVARDASGNFSANVITASLSGNVTGNATGTASALSAGADRTKLDSAVQSVNSKSGTAITLAPADIGAASRTWTYRTTTTTAVAGDRIAASTAGGTWVLTLPASPSAGMMVEVMDAGGVFATNPLTIGRNGTTIMSLAEDLSANVNNVNFLLVYTGSTWRVA